MSVALDACHEWQRENLELMWTLEGRDRDEMLFMAGYRRALEDAAKDIDLSEFYDPDPQGQVSQECGHAETAAHRWLTARAAAPDPRETKD